MFLPVGLSSCDGSDSAAVIFGGTTGELTWTLTEDGVLTITGEGPMPDYRDGGTSETPPWYPHVNRISSLTIGEGVTRIGDYAYVMQLCDGSCYSGKCDKYGRLGFLALSEFEAYHLP